MKTIPSKTIKIKVNENEYVIDYPNNGQFIEIQAMKALLTRNTYGSISEDGSVTGQYARYTVDMIAFFSTCCPKMKKDLVVNSFSELDMLSSKTLLKTYAKEILPWLSEWEEVLNSADEEEATTA